MSPQRRGELRGSLDGLLDTHRLVTDRGSRVVLVTAPTGGGKTHTLDTFLSSLRGVTVAAVRALPWDHRRPWSTADRALTRFPSGPTRHPLLASSETTVAVALRSALRVAGPGTVVALDDADHADPDSLRGMVDAVESADSVLLVLPSSSSDPGPSADLVARVAAVTLRLDRLDTVSLRELVTARTGIEPSEGSVRRLLDLTGGDTATVTAITDHVGPDWWSAPHGAPRLPPTLRADVDARLRDLAPAHREVLEAASVQIPPAPLTELSALLPGASDDAVLAALDAGHRLGLVALTLAPGHATVEFTNPLLRAAVQAAVPPARLVALHTAAAGLARDRDPDAALAHRAALATGPDPGLATEYRRRADDHVRAGRWGAAGDALLTAARLTDDPDRRLEWTTSGIDALIGAGRISEAGALTRGLDRVRPDPHRDSVLALLALHRGHATEADTLLGLAARTTPTRPDDRVDLARKMVVHALCGWRPDEIARWTSEVVDAAGTGSTSPAAAEARAVAMLGSAISAPGAPGPPPPPVDPADPVAQRFEMAAGWIALAGDDLETARVRLEAAIPTTEVTGSARISLWSQAWLARTLLLRGEWDDALRVVDTAARRIDELELDLLAPVVHWTGAVIRAMRGDRLGAATHTRHLTTRPDAYPVQILPSAMARMQVAAANGEHSGARRAAEPILALATRLDVDQPGFWPWHELYAHALVLDGRTAGAEELITPVERRAREIGHRSTLARLGAVRARILNARGDVEGAERLFRDSLDHLEGLGMPFHSARVHLARGQALRRSGRRREAHLALGAARDLYEQLGATVYVDRCDRERRAGGVDVARTVGPVGLTPQERAVADLVAAGRTNAQTAEALFLSVKTVQYHLTRIYARLGLRGRTELALYVERTAGAD